MFTLDETSLTPKEAMLLFACASSTPPTRAAAHPPPARGADVPRQLARARLGRGQLEQATQHRVLLGDPGALGQHAPLVPQHARLLETAPLRTRFVVARASS